MILISYKDFNTLYQDVVRSVFEHWSPQMQKEIAIHCYSWGPGRFDFRNYLQLSSIRFYKAYRSFAGRGSSQKVCDVGGFWGVFPLILKALGYDVIMTESLRYYGGSFDSLFKYITDNGVTILDYDPFQPEASLQDHFDVVTIMAVLEHYPHSLRTFMKNIAAMMKLDGRVYIEVPNLVYWPKRINFLLGRTPQPPIKEIFYSEVPFIGHHHEFTISELRDLAVLSNLEIISESYYNYSQKGNRLMRLLRHPFSTLVFSIVPSARECLAIMCSKKRA
jgi:2-polyprenyl-3-methyl-5-hydroxy-6-metoxy-1,4-benzoquinol methylase